MDMIADIVATIVAQMQKPTLAFLIGGMLIAAAGSRLTLPEPAFKLIVLILLLKVGLSAGLSLRETDIAALAVPAFASVAIGVGVVLAGARILARRPGVNGADAMATVGLFGAVSASTLAAGMAMLDAEGVAYEGFIAALYPFMDVAALATAIVLARLSAERRTEPAAASYGGAATASLAAGGGQIGGVVAREVLADTLKSPAISALLLGIGIGFFSRAEAVFEGFYQPLFHGMLSLLMLMMGMEAWSRLAELRKVAHVYVAYALIAPLAHGFVGLCAGLAAHQLTGFSGGGVVLLAVMAASSSDISGPPTMRAALPEANPSAYVGASTGVGTPVAILAIPLFIAIVDAVIGL